jgi:hypothetical protein
MTEMEKSFSPFLYFRTTHNSARESTLTQVFPPISDELKKVIWYMNSLETILSSGHSI